MLKNKIYSYEFRIPQQNRWSTEMRSYFFTLNQEVSCVIKRESFTFIDPLLPPFAVTQLMITIYLCKLLPRVA